MGGGRTGSKSICRCMGRFPVDLVGRRTLKVTRTSRKEIELFCATSMVNLMLWCCWLMCWRNFTSSSLLRGHMMKVSST